MVGEKIWYKCVYRRKKGWWDRFSYTADSDDQAIEYAKQKLKTLHNGRNVSRCFIEKYAAGKDSLQIYSRR